MNSNKTLRFMSHNEGFCTMCEIIDSPVDWCGPMPSIYKIFRIMFRYSASITLRLSNFLSFKSGQII